MARYVRAIRLVAAEISISPPTEARQNASRYAGCLRWPRILAAMATRQTTATAPTMYQTAD
jgi:hypothetical protein